MILYVGEIWWNMTWLEKWWKNGQPIVNIPRTQDPCTIQKYKNGLGVGYQSINVYLLPHDDQNTSPLGDNCISGER